jgi:hypothetical protein
MLTDLLTDFPIGLQADRAIQQLSFSPFTSASRCFTPAPPLVVRVGWPQARPARGRARPQPIPSRFDDVMSSDLRQGTWCSRVCPVLRGTWQRETADTGPSCSVSGEFGHSLLCPQSVESLEQDFVCVVSDCAVRPMPMGASWRTKVLGWLSAACQCMRVGLERSPFAPSGELIRAQAVGFVAGWTLDSPLEPQCE